MNLKLLLIAHFLVAFYLNSISQNSQLYSVKQKVNTEDVLKDIFTNKYNFKSSYLFGAILPLGGCPRCEGSVTKFFNDTKRINSDMDQALFVICSDEGEAIEYLKHHQYGINKIFILSEDNALINSLHFTTGSIGIPYLLIFDINKGRLCKSASTLGINYDDTFYHDFTSDLSTLDSMVIVNSNDTPFNLGTVKIVPNRYIIDSLKYDRLLKSKLNSASKMKFFGNKEKLAILSNIFNEITVFEIKNDSLLLLARYKDTEEELNKYTDPGINAEIIEYLVNINLIRTIYLDMQLFNNEIRISASLPKLLWEDRENEKIGYYNIPVIITIPFSNPDLRSYTVLDPDDEYELDHTRFYFDSHDQTYYFPYKKGWPVVGVGDQPENNTESPFTEEFYNLTPTFTIFDSTGIFIEANGTLHEWHQNNKTGYYFFDPIIKSDDQHIYIGDRKLGSISIIDKSSKAEKSLQFTKLNDYDESSVNQDTQLKQIICKGKNLTTEIFDFVNQDSIIYSVLKRDKIYYLYIYDIANNNTLKDEPLPIPENAKHIGIFATSLSDVVIYFLTEFNNTPKIYLITIKQLT